MDLSAAHEVMSRALALAKRGRFTTDPNPNVGCVIVNDGEVVGEGFHAYAGESHAERIALQQAGVRAAGSTVVVTLEPCSHTGRTGPCANALIDAEVARVIYAMEDPNPQVAGAGAARLRAAGIDVHSGVLAEDAERLNLGFVKRMRTGMPYVRAKLASSLDGRTALSNGESRWITGEPARADVHRYRAASSVILTGSGTVERDDPHLGARLDDDIEVRQPSRAVVDGLLRTRPSSKVFRKDAPVHLFTASTNEKHLAEFREQGVDVNLQSNAHPVDLQSVIRRLATLEYNEVWVEAGAGLQGSLIADDLIDELILYYSPCLLGFDGKGLVDIREPGKMAERLNFELGDVRRFGADLRLTLLPVR